MVLFFNVRFLIGSRKVSQTLPIPIIYFSLGHLIPPPPPQESLIKTDLYPADINVVVFYMKEITLEVALN